MKLWLVRYDEAAEEYAKACSAPKLVRRHNMNYWKKTLAWLDSELAKAGECYIEKTEEAQVLPNCLAKNNLHKNYRIAGKTFKAKCGHTVRKGEQYLVTDDFFAYTLYHWSACMECAAKTFAVAATKEVQKMWCPKCLSFAERFSSMIFRGGHYYCPVCGEVIQK